MRTYGELQTQVIYIDTHVLTPSRPVPETVGGGSGSNVIYKIWDGNSVTIMARPVHSAQLIPQIINDEDTIFEPRLDISGKFPTVLIELYLTSSVDLDESCPFSLSLERKIDNGNWSYTGETTFIAGKKNSNYIKFLDTHGLTSESSLYYRFRNTSIENDIGNNSIMIWVGFTAYCKLEEY